MTGSASPFAGAAPAIAEQLRIQGADVELVPLGDSEIVGNGYGLIFELNSTDMAARVLEWIDARE